MYWKIFTNNYLKKHLGLELHFFKYAIVSVIIPIFLLLHTIMVPINLVEMLLYDSLIEILKDKVLLKRYLQVYPVIVEHKTYSPLKEFQIPVYSSITSGGSGGITKEFGFHTLSPTDELYISYTVLGDNIIQNKVKENIKENIIDKSDEGLSKTEPIIEKNHRTSSEASSEDLKQKLPTKIPANYRFRNDFALRWDNSPQFAIASVELKGYKYFRDMLRQIRDNFSPPGLNLIWRDNAGVVISQPIKPQVVSVLFLLDYDGTVRDVKITSSMGQKPVDEACIRVLLNQNFGEPPPEIFEHGNIFGINFIFPPLY